MKNNIRLFFVLIFALFLGKTYAQSHVMNLQGYNEQPYHFGFILGMNTMNFSVKPIDNLEQHKWSKEQANLPNADFYSVSAVIASAAPGFSVGILGNLRLLKYLDMRFIPTLSFGSRTLDYSISATGMAGVPSGTDSAFVVHKKVNSTYLTFPLLLKYRSWRANNVGAYFLGGINLSIDLAAVKKTKQDLGSGTIILKTHDIGLEAGAGFDFYTNYFKLGIEAKMIYGLNNLIVNNNDMYSGSISQLRSKVFMLSFIFE